MGIPVKYNRVEIETLWRGIMNFNITQFYEGYFLRKYYVLKRLCLLCFRKEKSLNNLSQSQKFYA